MALAAVVGMLVSGPAGATSPATTATASFVTSSSPEGVALDAERGLVFVAAGPEVETEPPAEGTDTEPPDPVIDTGDAAISIFDMSGTLVGSVPTQSNTEYLLYAEDGQRLYVSTGDDSGVTDNQAVSVVDTSDPAHPAVVKTILLPVDPTSPDGKRYDPQGVALDPANGIVYVAAKSVEKPCSVPDPREPDECEEPPQHGVILAIDMATDELIEDAVFQAGDDPEDIEFNQKDSRLYAANEDDGTLTIVNAVRRNADGSLTLPGAPLTTRVVFTGTCPDADPTGDFDEYNEADKLIADQTTGTVYLTDDLWRVAAIPKGWNGTADVPVQTIGSCALGELGPDSANNVAVDEAWGTADADGVPHGLVYVTSEATTITVLDGRDLHAIDTITVADVVHLDAIAVDSASHRIVVTDEDALRGKILEATDTAAPVSTAVSAPAPDAEGVNHEPVAFTFAANDDETGGSGVKEIHAVAGGVEHVLVGASGSLTISSNGATTLEYWAVDQAGNAEAKHAATVKVDIPPPPPPPSSGVVSSGGGSSTPGAGGSPDLAVALTGPAAANVGDTVTFNVRVSDLGGMAGNPKLTVTLPNGSTVGSVTTNRGSCSTAGSVVTCMLDFLRSDLTAEVAIVAQLGGSGAQTVRAQVSTESDTNAANNAATASVSVNTPGAATPATPPAAPAKVAAPKVVRAGAGGFLPPLQLKRQGKTAVVALNLRVDKPATLRIRLVDPRTGRTLTLLKGSRAGGLVLTRAQTSLTAKTAARVLPLSLRVDGAKLLKGKTYRVTVVATGAGGTRTAVFPVRG